MGVASASLVRQGKGDEPVGADDYVVEKRNPNELADLAQPSRQLDLFPGDCVGLPFWIHPRGLCVARHLLGKAMSRTRPHVRTSPVSAAHLPAQQASRLAANQANSNPAVAFIDHSLSPYCPPAAAAVRPVAPPSVGSSSQP